MEKPRLRRRSDFTVRKECGNPLCAEHSLVRLWTVDTPLEQPLALEREEGIVAASGRLSRRARRLDPFA